jgi:hypothetical protein
MVKKILFTQQQLDYIQDLFENANNNNWVGKNRQDYIVNSFFEHYRENFDKAVSYMTLQKNYLEYINNKRLRFGSTSALLEETSSKRPRSDGNYFICFLDIFVQPLNLARLIISLYCLKF